MFDDEELDIGLRVTMKDSFSANATKIEGAWKRLQARLDGSFSASGFRRMMDLADGARTGFVRLERGVRSLTSFLPSFGMMFLAAGVALHRLIGNTMRAGSEIENLEIAFTTMLGSADAARAHLEELQRFALGRPFEFSQLASASRVLQTFGFQAQDVTGLLQDFGDAAFTANTGFEGVERMSRVFGQIRATGKTTVGHLRQLVNSGIPAYDILRERLHLTGEQLQNIARSGIPAERVLTALREGMRERFAGGMDRASATLTAKLSDLQDVTARIYRSLYQTLGPHLIYFVDMLSQGLTTNADGIASVLHSVVSTVLYVARIVTGVLGGAFGDVRAKWTRDAGGSLRSVTSQLARFAAVVEGVAVLVSGDDGRGLSRIPKAMQENLVRRGLWRSTVEFSRFFGRVRAFLGGFVEGFSKGLDTAKKALDRMASALGVSGLATRTTRADAARLGATVATLIVSLFALRGALLAVRAAATVGGGALSVARFAAANPVLFAVAVAVVAIGAACAYAYTHAEQLTSTAPKWQALRTALSVLAGPLVEVSLFAARAEVVMETWRKRMSGAGKELRAVWDTVKAAVLGFVDRVASIASAITRPFEVARAFIVLAFYVAFAKVVQFLTPFVERFKTAALGMLIPILAGALMLSARLKAWAHRTFAPYLLAARTIWTHVRDAITQRAVEMYANLRTRTVGVVAALLHIWQNFKTGVSGMFDGLLERLLAPLRNAARELVSMYRALPSNLQNPALAGMVGTLDAFGAGPVPDTNAMSPAAQAGAVVDTSGAAAVNTTNIARTTNIMTASARGGSIVVPAPQVVVNPPTAVVMLNGREIARAVEQDQGTRATRAGATPPATRGGRSS